MIQREVLRLFQFLIEATTLPSLALMRFPLSQQKADTGEQKQCAKTGRHAFSNRSFMVLGLVGDFVSKST